MTTQQLQDRLHALRTSQPDGWQGRVDNLQRMLDGMLNQQASHQASVNATAGTDQHGNWLGSGD